MQSAEKTEDKRGERYTGKRMHGKDTLETAREGSRDDGPVGKVDSSAKVRTIRWNFDGKNGVRFVRLLFRRDSFAVKMSPWIRINGSLNRRVLDKYLGTILLHCIENTGVTLFNLCTRFYYLTPVHIKEIVDHLESLGCLRTSAFVKRAKVLLFSTYQPTEIGTICADFRLQPYKLIEALSTVFAGPASELNGFGEIMIEPTIDAVTRMSVFIGDKKYNDDFI